MAEEEAEDAAEEEKSPKKRKRRKKKKGDEQQSKSTQADNEKPAKKGAPAWVTTFADLMSLLMCFFVMLLSMSEIDTEKFKAMIEGMTRGFDTKNADVAIKSVEAKAESKNKARMSDREKTVSDAVKLQDLLKPMIQKGQVELLVRDGLIVIRVLQGGSFKSGSSKLKIAFKPIARKLKKILAEIEGTVAISGHTDDRAVKSRRFRDNFELSSSRAYSVLHELLKGGDVPPNRFVVNGYAETQPLAPNDTVANRNRNRRVELIINQGDLGYLETDHETEEEEEEEEDKGPKLFDTMPTRG